jgi:hypothetical protein
LEKHDSDFERTSKVNANLCFTILHLLALVRSKLVFRLEGISGLRYQPGTYDDVTEGYTRITFMYLINFILLYKGPPLWLIRVPGYRSRGLGLISVATRFSEK